MRNRRGKLARAGYAAKGPKTRAVTASRFKDARLTCGLSLPDAAKLFRVTLRTLQNWESGRVRVPYSAYKLMRVLRGHELAHPAWRGFRVVGDTLWTPEGRPFRPDHMTWWSLTCRMADEFRALVRSRLPACRPAQIALDSVQAALPASGLADPNQHHSAPSGQLASHAGRDREGDAPSGVPILTLPKRPEILVSHPPRPTADHASALVVGGVS